MWVDLNPKAVVPNELFGFINPATREWKDGKYIRMYKACGGPVHVSVMCMKTICTYVHTKGLQCT